VSNSGRRIVSNSGRSRRTHLLLLSFLKIPSVFSKTSNQGFPWKCVQVFSCCYGRTKWRTKRVCRWSLGMQHCLKVIVK
jgi:hypothetical protein